MHLVDADVDADKPDFEDCIADQNPDEDFALGNPYLDTADKVPGVVAPDPAPATGVHLLNAAAADPPSRLK